MELKYFREDKLDYLRANIQENISNGNYLKEDVWVDKWFDENFEVDSRIIVHQVNLIIPEESGTKTDFENCKRLYLSLKDLTVEQATDSRLWTYLTHVTCWDYMIKRWPINEENEKKANNTIKKRYFLRKNSDRALVENGLSRLWWIAYSTYDESLKDPFEITEFLFKDSDLQKGIMERSFFRNSGFLKNTIKSIKQYSQKYEFPIREDRRRLLKEINRIGGVKLLDMLEYDEINSVIFKLLKGYKNQKKIV
ncbi:DUF6339 family protein [Clostridium sporogenes]|uniref:DUF6339 family protein n=1 Tax=Clostridium TaxID=1485 RepID=UPI00100B0902|nr:DUF6339 family protein [Clostridium tetani]RXM73690.1 hypothetical protein DP154_13770 [Clostridium tetani]RYU97805.1 hypothetical protein DP144_13950 [Clostridium tetani]